MFRSQSEFSILSRSCPDLRQTKSLEIARIVGKVGDVGEVRHGCRGSGVPLTSSVTVYAVACVRKKIHRAFTTCMRTYQLQRMLPSA